MPFAREEFGIVEHKSSDKAEYDRIIMNATINQGKTYLEALKEVSHLMSMHLKFNLGWNIDIYGGYNIREINLGLNWKYINFSYKSIEGIDTSDDSLAKLWDSNGSGKTIINALVAFVEYNIFALRFYDITPIFSGGIGFANVKNEISFDSKTKNRNNVVFAYQVKLGAGYKFTNKLHGSIGTAFFGTSKIEAINTSLKQWEFINIGVKYLFI